MSHALWLLMGCLRFAGYRIAAETARTALENSVRDNREDIEKFRSDLCNIAMTTLSSKILSQDKEHFANLAVDAVLRLKVHLLGYLYPGCDVVL
jgi:chaperonin GroEL (HSP60 family)